MNGKVLQISPNKAIVDLVVLSFNGLKTSQDFIKYFYKNTSPKDAHLIWVDNGSTDGTIPYLQEIADEKDNFSLISMSENYGVIGGRNFGYDFSKANPRRGNYLMFLDNDQFVQQGWLEDHMSFLNDNHYDLVGVEAWQMNSLFMPILKISSAKQHFNYVGCGGMLMKNIVPDTIGMFDERFNPAYFEDPDLNLRSYQAGFKIGWNSKAKIVHIPHQTLGKLNVAEKSKRFGASIRKFREKWKGVALPIFRQG